MVGPLVVELGFLLFELQLQLRQLLLAGLPFFGEKVHNLLHFGLHGFENVKVAYLFQVFDVLHEPLFLILVKLASDLLARRVLVAQFDGQLRVDLLGLPFLEC